MNYVNTTNNSQILIWQDEAGKSRVDVVLENNDIWLTQTQIAVLYNTTQPNISMHISNIYATFELKEDRTYKNFLLVQMEGNRKVTRSVKYYNLEMFIALGYKVNSQQATRFRIWATQVLKQQLKNQYQANPKQIDDYFNSVRRNLQIAELGSYNHLYERMFMIFVSSIDFGQHTLTHNSLFNDIKLKLSELYTNDIHGIEIYDTLLNYYIKFSYNMINNRVALTMLDWGTIFNVILEESSLDILTVTRIRITELTLSKLRNRYNINDNPTISYTRTITI